MLVNKAIEQKKTLLLIFYKNPELGKVKTRLAKAIGNKNALIIYQCLTEKTQQCLANSGIAYAVLYSDFITQNDIWTNSCRYKKLQRGMDLGQRMANAVKWAHSLAYEKIILLGTDLWSIEVNDIIVTLQKLNHYDIVFGPATDGGYYLLGIKEFLPNLFLNKPWSSSNLLTESIKAIEEKKIFLLDKKTDIDTLADLEKFPYLYQKIAIN